MLVLVTTLVLGTVQASPTCTHADDYERSVRSDAQLGVCSLVALKRTIQEIWGNTGFWGFRVWSCSF